MYIVLIALGVILSLLRGLVISILWGWFAVPLFGLPAIGIAYAIGLSTLLAGFFGVKISMEESKLDSKESTKLGVLRACINCVFMGLLLVTGAIAKAFL